MTQLSVCQTHLICEYSIIQGMPRKVYGCIIGANTIPAHDRCREKGISLSELPVTKPNSHASVASRKRSSDINTNHPSST